jgi:YVTN family beta-propeller protein
VLRSTVIALLLLLAACGAEHDAGDESSNPPEPKGLRLYVTNEMSGDLSIIDPQTRSVLGRIPLGKRPRGIVPSADGRLLYIALSGSPIAGPGVDESTLPPADKSADGIAVFDVASGRIQRIIRGVSDPETVAVSPDGTRLYVASEDTGQLIILDASSGGQVGAHPVGGEPEGVAVGPDGRLVYATSEEDHTVAVLDTEQGQLRARIRVGLRPRNAVFTAAGDRAYVPGENDASVSAIAVAQDRVVRSVRIEGENIRPMDVRLTPNGEHLFVTTGRGRQLIRMNPQTLEVTGRVEVGERPWGLAITPDGRFAFTANGPSNDVAMVDTASMRVVARFTVGERPWGVTIVPIY